MWLPFPALEENDHNHTSRLTPKPDPWTYWFSIVAVVQDDIDVLPSLHLSVVAIEKGAIWSLSTAVANFTYLFSKESKILSIS